MEEIFLDPGFFWSWERFEDRWTNYFGYAEEDLVPVHVDVMESYESLVCGNLKSSFMKDTQFIKVRGLPWDSVIGPCFTSWDCGMYMSE